MEQPWQDEERKERKGQEEKKSNSARPSYFETLGLIKPGSMLFMQNKRQINLVSFLLPICLKKWELLDISVESRSRDCNKKALILESKHRDLFWEEEEYSFTYQVSE